MSTTEIVNLAPRTTDAIASAVLDVKSAAMDGLQLSPTQFRELLERITNLAANYLQDLDSLPIVPDIRGSRADQLFRQSLPETGLGMAACGDLAEMIENCRVQNGRFFGYVLGSGEPVAAAADLLASVVNQNVTAWRSSPAAATIERTVVGWIAEAIGCAGFRGSLTGGGSSANLMGLAMARENKAAANHKGSDGSRATVYASEEVHMSIPKSVGLLGIGQQNLRLIPADENYRLLPDALESAIESDRKNGYKPIAVVASAGTVNTGAIDPLVQISAIAKKFNLWLHVDGAYGALAAIAAPSRFQGLNLADSVSLDPHKWLYQPLDCGCLLYRDENAARATFSHTGDYAKSMSADPVEGFAFFDESMELSRRFRALKLWLSLRFHGLAAFRSSIQKDMDLAQRLAAAIAKTPSLELLATGELSAVCFRCKDAPEIDPNAFNSRVLKRVLERGRVYLSNATLRGKFALRACIVNHRTTAADVDSVIPEVLEAAREVTS